MSLDFYSEKEEENNRAESINEYKYLFSNYENNPLSLSEALIQMFESCKLDNNEVKELTEDILNKSKESIDSNFDAIKKKYNNITKEDTYTIISYTYESKEREYSPFRILNQNLVSDDLKIGINNVSKYLYLFLKALRKLPKYYPKNKYFYRCLTINVGTSKEPNNEKIMPYIAGNIKKFLGFISVSPDPKNILLFFKKRRK